jgi:Raf kinase inhibitor-like YbhB/YbcL family protein
MSKSLAILIIILVIIGGVWFTIKSGQNTAKPEQPFQQIKEIKPMNFLSPTFKKGENIPAKYTCKGENISMPLQIENVDPGVKSLALIVDDPDAPKGDWAHWVMWNIDPSTKSISENSVPKGAVVGVNDFGQNNYGGPCPPSGTHRYFFKLYALDSKLIIISFSAKADLLKAMEGHVIGKAEFFGIVSKDN